MDPNATLRDLLEYRDEIFEEWDNATEDGECEATDREICIAELIDALDGWISRGGFLPQKWRK